MPGREMKFVPSSPKFRPIAADLDGIPLMDDSGDALILKPLPHFLTNIAPDITSTSPPPDKCVIHKLFFRPISSTPPGLPRSPITTSLAERFSTPSPK